MPRPFIVSLGLKIKEPKPYNSNYSNKKLNNYIYNIIN